MPVIDHRISYLSEKQLKGIILPERFTFPFFYQPHPIALIAVAELQHYLETRTDLGHNFGLNEEIDGTPSGKMFGVLVVKDSKGKLGYLSAFSGNLAGKNDHPGFVPPVFDTLEENSFFVQGIEIIDSINAQVREMESREEYRLLKLEMEDSADRSAKEIAACKEQLKRNKDNRKQIREAKKEIFSQPELDQLEATLISQSLYDKRQLKALVNKWEEILNELRARIVQFDQEIESCKNERKQRSAALQQQLFDQYSFLNIEGKRKSLQEIFRETPFGRPPAAAGECATPKLLQYAFSNAYTPIAMAEFWWGISPKSEIRKHKQFYPACTGKCKSILSHMLDGMLVDEAPLNTPELRHEVEIIYEDEALVVVNKPAGLRSVPGVHVRDSVYSRLQYLLAGTEPLMVHRLDMDTSGLIVVAKTKQAHKHIQWQFLKRTVRKRYRALLSKAVDQPGGEIDLPLCPDLFNRPRQLVCFKNGKKSFTKWKLIYSKENMSKVDFWPLTGRTHQLRMHAAHELGLNAPIVGDDLYGIASERMCLHAAYLEFVHPQTKETISFEVQEEF
ncbi:MAG: RNA pseudouridine synthase [Chitinophagaceae bacterium]|nr:RNA pseudouridine synthase [Chitinophagaceae bacterium]